ncbi:hypothetical protein KAFR_0I00910 [Kazachstania africana CBS 2517]|uniref:t-SNARE coiled-coil homology domain-containing protein n=1 Tax=Kazachstania africana (strain ATCC 22294 / BCRC 22015 / CBS 2517 / CECT 1963 / NBRC 1671 / NRRL Y-8276) TaxID=1071382 RepID=H2AZS2_KAZAF|nr:hypothetical protein KAFR_0I00910 [Kazachstania africana CBS 2517]CCF59872.1 hypothetical protein KAFR_0I00910 [Kazachstania africana CBS 2517]
MGLKKFLKIKPPKEATVEENRQNLMDLGISVKNPNKKKTTRFDAYGKFANDRRTDRSYAPEGYAPSEIDLNKSELDSVSNFDEVPQDLKLQTHKHDSSRENSKEPTRVQTTYDPFAVNTDVESFASNPYTSFKTNMMKSNDTNKNVSNAERTAIRSQDPYSMSDRRTAPSQDPYSMPDRRTTVPQQKAYNYGGNSSVSTNNDPYRINSFSEARNNVYQNRITPTASRDNSPAPTKNPYSSMSSSRSNPYSNLNAANFTANPYGDSSSYKDANVYDNSNSSQNVYVKKQDNISLNLNATQSELFGSRNDTRTPMSSFNYDPDDDLNNVIDEYNYDSQSMQQQQQLQEQETFDLNQEPEVQEYDNKGYVTFDDMNNIQQEQEDEEIDQIKQEIRFVKQSSLASTKNTLKMAMDAEKAGMNTLGLLGHQSEKLNTIETNLDLIKVQNVTAEDKVSELEKLNRSIFAVHVGNPFNSRRRRREKEDTLRNRKIQENFMIEETNKSLYASTHRIENAMNGTDKSASSSMQQKYKRDEILQRAKAYQFENDEEDDDVEIEIDRNLDKIKQVSGRLRKLAIAAGDEVDAQRSRLMKIEEGTESLDIKLHMNSTRLANIK